MSKVNLAIDASQLDLYCVCPARFNYRYNLCRDEPSHVRFEKGTGEQKGHPLDRGIVIHAGLAAYYSALQEKIRYAEAVHRGIQASHLKITETDIPDSEVRFLIDVLVENIDYWRVEDQNIEVLAVENPFTYELYSDEDVRIFMTGVIDLLYKDDKHDKIIRDHKTFSRDSELVELNNQFMNYCNAINCFFLEVNRIGLQKSLKPEEKYKRPILSYDEELLADWRKNTIKWMMQYLEHVATNEWPMNLTSCDKFNRKCEYLPICRSSGEESKQFKLASQYKKTEPWDVTKILVPRGDHQL